MKKKRCWKGFALILALILAVNMGAVSASAKSAVLKKGSTFTKGGLTYEVTSLKGKKGTVKVVGAAKKNVKSVEVPNSVKTKGYTLTVNEIGNGAFKNCAKLQKVTTGKTLKKIGGNAFSGCKKLKTLDLSKSTKLTKVGKNVLKGSSKVKVEVPEAKAVSYRNKLGIASSMVVVKKAAQTEKQTEAKAKAPETEAQKKAPETEAQVKTPETEAQKKAPETEAQVKAPETEAQTKAPETEGQTKAPETEAQTKAPETSVPEIKPQANAPETKAPEMNAPQANAPETKAPEMNAPQADAPEMSAPGTEEPQTDGPEMSEPETQEQTSAPETEAQTTAPETEKETESEGTPEVKCPNGNHVFAGEWKESQKATCTQYQTLIRSCVLCGKATESKFGEKPTGHTYEHKTDEPTCEKSGAEYDICTVCGAKSNVREIPATGHQWVKKEEKGEGYPCTGCLITYEECSVCHKHRGSTEVTPAPGHDWQETRVVPPTCSADGYTIQTCSVCGSTKKIVDFYSKVPHNFTSTKTEEATCTTEGYTVRVCGTCGYEEKTVSQPALGHSFGAPKVTKQATCTENGEEVSRCTREGCNLESKKVIPRTDHKLGRNKTNPSYVDQCVYCDMIYDFTSGTWSYQP